MSQFDNGEDEWKRESHSAQYTGTLLAAIKRLEETDFNRYLASGIVVRLLNLSNQEICPQFMMEGSDMEGVKVPIIESLRRSLQLRMISRLSETNEIRGLLGLEKLVAPADPAEPVESVEEPTELQPAVIDALIAYLNRLFAADKALILTLLATPVVATQGLAAVLQDYQMQPMIGTDLPGVSGFSLLNGMLEVMGLPRIMIKWENNEAAGFVRWPMTAKPADPPPEVPDSAIAGLSKILQQRREREPLEYVPPVWTPADYDKASSEGWTLQRVGDRYFVGRDGNQTFQTDQDARAFVSTRAAAGDTTALKAVALHDPTIGGPLSGQ